MSPQTLVFASLLQQAAQPDLLDWQALRVGVEIHLLYGQAAKGPAAALLRYAPGAQVPEHQHLGYEHILVLQGSQSDANGCHQSGTLLASPPQSRHAIISEEGCVVLAIWAGPLQFTNET